MNELETSHSLDDILQAKNVAELLSEVDRITVQNLVVNGFDEDKTSRATWEQRTEDCIKLALQVKEKKTTPWIDASNVKFPLLTIAVLQYHSRAYPALVNLPDVVKFETMEEEDEQPPPQQPPAQQGQPQQPPPPSESLLMQRSADRISAHMNWQLAEEDEQWEESQDKTLIVQALLGSTFKKTYFSSSLKRNVSELVLPQDLVINYWAKSLDEAPRITHILLWDSNTLVERMRRGECLETDVENRPQVGQGGSLSSLPDKVQGIAQPTTNETSPFTILEQHLWLDLDGDSYKEPYVAFVRYDTKELLRLVPRFLPSGIERQDGQVVRITPESFFTHYLFIPSPDGGIYGLGFGHFLTPINASINTAINQLFDAGTLKNAGGGFLGRGFKSKGGEIQVRPGKFSRVDSTGDDLRKSIVPYPVGEPSPVLFQLLSLLIDYGQRVAGAPDMIQGQNPGQNTPAETSRSMVEQGMKVFSSIYKRTYRAMKQEFRKVYRLNQLYLEKSQTFLSVGSRKRVKVLAQDYQLPASSIFPSADSSYMSDSQKMGQANALLQVSHAIPGFDLYQVGLAYLKAWNVPTPNLFLPNPKGPSAIPSPPNPKLQIEQLRIQAKQAELKQQLMVQLSKLAEEHELNKARILELEAKASHELAKADGVEAGHQLALLDAQIGAAKMQQEGRLKSMEILNETMALLHERQKGDVSETSDK